VPLSKLLTVALASGLMGGRLLDVTLGDPRSNVALEEALFRRLQGPVLRVWDNQRCVVIGRAQLAGLETDLGACMARGVPVVRRFTAGGAVYHGPGNINWSFLEPRSGRDGEGRVFDAKGVFMSFAGRVVAALAGCGVDCIFEPPNRLVTAEGKISGMAAYQSSSGVICHGTLLADADLEEVEELTRPSAQGAEARYPRSRHATVANCGVDRARFVEALAGGGGGPYAKGELTGGEASELRRLVAERYGRDDWNLGDPFAR
jgi:lipoate-protein ligase A